MTAYDELAEIITGRKASWILLLIFNLYLALAYLGLHWSRTDRLYCFDHLFFLNYYDEWQPQDEQEKISALLFGFHCFNNSSYFDHFPLYFP